LFLLFGFSVGTSGGYHRRPEETKSIEAIYKGANDEERLEMLQFAFDETNKKNPTMTSTKSDASSPAKELILKYPGLGGITADARRRREIEDASDRESQTALDRPSDYR
jgi:hypothetical protein